MIITQRHWRWLLPLALLYGLLAGIRWPQTYALTHMVIDYHLGFGKRGLIGAILHLVDNPPYHYVGLAIIAFIVSASWLLCLCALGGRLIREDFGVAAAFGLFFLSIGFASLVRDVGRGEHFGLLLALPCLALPVTWPWLAARVALLIAAMLMHEGNFLVVVPLVAFDVLIATEAAWSVRAIRAAAVALPVALVTFFLSNNIRDCNAAEVVAFYQRQVADFTFLPVPVLTLCLNGGANLSAAVHDLWGIESRAIMFPLTALITLPSTAFNLWLARRVLAGRNLDIVAAIGAAVAPLCFLLIAVDLVRFATLIQLTSLVAALAAARRVGLPEGGSLLINAGSVALVAAIAAIELGSSVRLNDGVDALKFPFVPLVEHIDDVLHRRAPFVVVPTY